MPRPDSTSNVEPTVFRSRIKIPVIFLVPTVALLSLYCVFYFYVNSNWFLEDLPAWLHQGFGGDFEVEELVVEPSLTDLHLYGATIAKAGADRPVIDAPEVHASLELIHLLQRRLVFDRGVARGADVQLTFDEDNRLNLLEALGLEDAPDDPPPESGGDPLEIAFPNLRAENCRFTMRRPDFEFTVPDVDIPHASITIGGGGLKMGTERIRLPRADFRFRPELFQFDPAEYGDWTFTVRDIEIDNWRWRDNGFRTDRVELFAEGAHIRANGRMGFGAGAPDEPTMSYRGEGRVTVPFWSSIGQYFIRDAVHFDILDSQIAVEGTLDMIDGGVAARAELLEAAGLTFTDIYGEATLQDEWIMLKRGRADVHGGTVRLDSGYFNMFQLLYGTSGRFEGVDPASVLRDLEVSMPSLAGRLSGGFELDGGIPRGLEFRGDPYPALDYAHRDYADVEGTDTWRFEPADSNTALPFDRLDIQKGMQFAVDEQRIAVSEARLSAPDVEGHLRHVAFDYQLSRFERAGSGPAVDVSVHVQDVGAYARSLVGLELGGQLHADLQASGAIPAPSARARLRWERPSFRTGDTTLQGEQGRLRVNFKEGRLRVTEFALDSKLGDAQASGQLDLYERSSGSSDWQLRTERSLGFDYTLERVRVGAIDQLFGGMLGVAGELEASGRIGGTLEAPSLDIDARLRDGSINPGGALPEPIALPGARARGEWTPERVQLSDVSVNLPGAGQLETSGAYRFADGHYRARGQIQQLELDRLAPLKALPETYRPSGRLSLEWHGQGATSSPTMGGDLQLEGFRLGSRRVGDVTFVMNTADETLHVVGAVLPIGSISIRIPFDPSKGYYARLRTEQLRWTEFFPELAEHPLIEALSTTGNITIDADRDLSDYTVTTRLESFQLTTPGGRLDNKGPLVLSLDNHLGLHVRRATLGIDGDYISVRGAVGLDDFVGALQIKGNLDLGLAHLLVERLRPDWLSSTLIDAQGLVHLDLKISGSPARPAAEGRLEFRTAEFKLRHVAEPLRIQSGVANFSPRGIEIDDSQSISGEMFGGLFELSGRIGLQQRSVGETSLKLWSHNMVYRLPDTANITFDTDLALEADALTQPETWRVSGQLQILDALYYRDISLIEQQLTGRVLGAFQTKTDQFEAGLLEQNPWLGDVTFDVGIRARDGVELESAIDRFALDMGFRLDLRLQQTLDDPRLAGEVDVIDGTVGFQAETFDVRTGTLKYTGDPGNPRVLITAGADIRNQCSDQQQLEQFESTFQFAGQFEESRRELYHVLLNVEGRLETLNVQLESQPHADQRDILSLMLTGCTVDALSASGATQPTLEIALGPLLGQFEKRVRDVVQLTEFSILPGVERTQVRIGDRLTRRIRWHFQLDTSLSDQTGGQRYQLEYKLSDRWAAEVSERSLRREENEYLLDLKLKYRVPLD